MSNNAPNWKIEVEPEYERSVSRELTVYQQEILDAAVRGVLAIEGTAVCQSHWGKSLGQGLYEFRVQKKSKKQLMQRVDPSYEPKPGDERSMTLRAFFITRGRRLILLLTAYDKGGNPSKKRQQLEIKTARSIAKHVMHNY